MANDRTVAGRLRAVFEAFRSWLLEEAKQFKAEPLPGNA